MWDHQEDNIYKYAVSRLHIAGGDVSKVICTCVYLCVLVCTSLYLCVLVCTCV